MSSPRPTSHPLLLCPPNSLLLSHYNRFPCECWRPIGHAPVCERVCLCLYPYLCVCLCLCLCLSVCGVCVSVSVSVSVCVIGVCVCARLRATAGSKGIRCNTTLRTSTPLHTRAHAHAQPHTHMHCASVPRTHCNTLEYTGTAPLCTAPQYTTL